MNAACHEPGWKPAKVHAIDVPITVRLHELDHLKVVWRGKQRYAVIDGQLRPVRVAIGEPA